MFSTPLLKLLRMVCFGFLLLTLIGSQKFNSKGESGLLIKLNAEQLSLINRGDLIFQRGGGLGSDIVYSVDTESLYSHVGLIDIKNGTIFVIHVTPNEANNNLVRYEKLSDFLKDVPLAAIYRVKKINAVEIDRAILEANSYVGKIKFDFLFNLSNSDQLYCTELVWNAYRAAGIDLIQGKFDFLSLPFLQSNEFILPSTLIASPMLTQVIVFTNQIP